MTKKPLAITAAALAVAAGAGGIAVAATGGGGAGELDAELNGTTMVLTVEAKDADAVRVTYGGATQDARLVPDDDEDANEDRDYVARFDAAPGDRTAGDQIAAKVAITRDGDTSTETLEDRLDVETADVDDDDLAGDDDGFETVAPATSGPATPSLRDLDADLVRGGTIVLTVEARDAKTVKLRYAGQTKTAVADRDDAGDRDQDFTARFTAAPGDRTNGTRITAKATAADGSQTVSRTLTDRLDVDTDG